MSERCPDALLPDGTICPRCGNERAPSGVDGGSWVHVMRSPRAAPDTEGETPVVARNLALMTERYHFWLGIAKGAAEELGLPPDGKAEELRPAIGEILATVARLEAELAEKQAEWLKDGENFAKARARLTAERDRLQENFRQAEASRSTNATLLDRALSERDRLREALGLSAGASLEEMLKRIEGMERR